MSPRFEPDFGATQVTTPVYPKGTYEVSITGVNGSAWDKSDDAGGSYTVRRVRARSQMRGVYDSKGKLKGEHDDVGEIEGKDVSPIDLYIHSEGAMRVAKSNMMAILGYNPREEKDEEAFNEWLAKEGADFGFEDEKGEDGSYDVTLGEGWSLLEGRNVVALLDIEMYKPDGADEPQKRQKVVTLLPVGAV